MNTIHLNNSVLDKLSQTAVHIRKNPPTTKAEMGHALRVFGAALQQLANWSENASSIGSRPRPVALDHLNKVCEMLVQHFEADALTRTLFVSCMDKIQIIAEDLDDWAGGTIVHTGDNVIPFPVKFAWPACAQPSNGGDAA